MKKLETKTLLIETGAKLIQLKGYKNSGLNEILDSAGVPKGSFYFYFKSKDDFVLSIIDYHTENYISFTSKFLKEDHSSSPVERLKNMFLKMASHNEESNCSDGCPLGNLAQEISNTNDAIRLKIKDSYILMCQPIENCLQEAIDIGDLDPGININETANFIQNSWEGALLAMKMVKNIEPVNYFIKNIFDSFLKK